MDVLATLIEDADPVAVLRYALDDLAHSQAELAEQLGSRSRAFEILNRRRHLTLDQIRTISDAWKLPVALLIKPYHLEHDAA